MAEKGKKLLENYLINGVRIIEQKEGERWRGGEGEGEEYMYKD